LQKSSPLIICGTSGGAQSRFTGAPPRLASRLRKGYFLIEPAGKLLNLRVVTCSCRGGPGAFMGRHASSGNRFRDIGALFGRFSSIAFKAFAMTNSRFMTDENLRSTPEKLDADSLLPFGVKCRSRNFSAAQYSEIV
jgi:hypothetical protein